jgi:chromosomal replication initiator protein
LECARKGGQEVTNDDREIVSALRARLADRVGKDRYEVWFGPSTRFAVRGGTLTVGVPNRFYQDWLRTHFRKDLEQSCVEALGQSLALEFRIDTAAAVAAHHGSPRPAAAPQHDVSQHPVLQTSVSQTTVSSQSAAAPSNTVAPPAVEPISRRRFASLDAFVVGDSNRLAFTTAQMAAERHGTISPLLFYGPHGVGKTHLLEGIWSAFKKSHRQASAIYLSAEQFTSYFLEALHGAGLPSFRRKYRNVELLVIDDIQFFAGKRATLVELLHTIDTIVGAGKQLVLAADRSPAALKALGPEIGARLAGAAVCRLEPPEYGTRLGIVRQLAARLELHVPEDVLSFVASHLTTQARELAGALKRLQATSIAHARPITLSMAEEALADLIHTSGRAVRLSDIEKAICDVFGLETESLQSNRKAKTVTYPRMLAMWLARKHTRAALSEIGHFFGRRSHSTVISAQKKIDSWVADGGSLDVHGRRCQVEDAIRRVEEHLHAG